MTVREHALYRLLPRPAADAAQGGCYLTASQGPCIDTGVNIYMEGTLTLSLGALTEMCEVAGFSFNAEGRKLEAENAALQHELAAARAENADLNEQLDAVSLAMARAAAPPPEPLAPPKAAPKAKK